jgi:hypothetical protein
MSLRGILALAVATAACLGSCGENSRTPAEVVTRQVPAQKSTALIARADMSETYLWHFACNAAWNQTCEQNEIVNFTSARLNYQLCKFNLEVTAVDPSPDWSTIDSQGSPSSRYIAVTGGLVIRDGTTIRNELSVMTRTSGSGNFLDRWGANYDFKVRYTIMHESASDQQRSARGCINRQIITSQPTPPANPETTSACSCVFGSRAEAQAVRSCLGTNGRCDLLPGVRHLQCVRPNSCLDAMSGGRCPFDFPNSGYQPPIEVASSPYCR